MTREKPKITHRMVRRISFMRTSFEWKGKSTGKTRRVCLNRRSRAPGQAHQGTKDGSAQAVSGSGNCLRPHQNDPTLAVHTPSRWVQTGKTNQAKDSASSDRS